MCGKDERALNVLSRINGASQAKVILAEIKATTEEKTERLFTYGWMVIFIGIMLSVFQQAVGINAVLYFAPRIFETMGMANPMVQTVLMGVVNILFTLLAVFTVEKWGRKPLLISGSVGMAIGAFGVAMCNIVTGLPAIISVISIMVYSASFMFSWGPICWVLIAEIFPNTIRGAAVAIAVAFNGFSTLLFRLLSCRCTICVSGRWAISSAICLHMPFTGLSAWQPPSSCGSLYPKRKARRWKI